MLKASSDGGTQKVGISRLLALKTFASGTTLPCRDNESASQWPLRYACLCTFGGFGQGLLLQVILICSLTPSAIVHGEYGQLSKPHGGWQLRRSSAGAGCAEKLADFCGGQWEHSHVNGRHSEAKEDCELGRGYRNQARMAMVFM